MQLEAIIKTEASRLGFKLSGFTQPDASPHYPAYLTWLEDGCQADMAYMARPDAVMKRRDPRALLPDCQSILCLALSCPSPRLHPKPTCDRPLGRISAYAWGENYHEVIRGKLQQLTAFIQAQAGTPVHAKACVDTAPILEKDFAQLAGLGWIGKNSCFITVEFGSFVFLAELLLNLPLQPDQPQQIDPCEGCLRCHLACPTKAIRPDRSIDARRCLSYLTIEQSGSIPAILRPYLEDRIFGCDTCQSVCPHNCSMQNADFDDAFTPKIDPYPDLISELTLTEEDFKRKYQGTPVLRAKRQGYLRNVAIALGNQPYPTAIQPLTDLLHSDPAPVIQDSCRWALANINSVA